MSTDNVKDLEEERDALLARIKEMDATLEGCDWCCGGGDEEAAEITIRLRQIDQELSAIASNDPVGKA